MDDVQVIEGASRYALAPSGYIYNVDTKRRLKRDWIDGRWQTLVKTDDGRSCRVQHDLLHVPSQKPPSPRLPRLLCYSLRRGLEGPQLTGQARASSVYRDRILYWAATLRPLTQQIR